MKKIVSVICMTLLLFTALPVFAVPPITVSLDFSDIAFDQEPIIENDRTLVPLRAIFEAMGAKVQWDENTQTVTSSLTGTTVIMTVGNNSMLVNGFTKQLDVPPKLVGGRTMVPARAVAESFGGTVSWNADLRKVTIRSGAFHKKIEKQKTFSLEKELEKDGVKLPSAFTISYFEEYEMMENLTDGTDVLLSHTDPNGHVSLNIQSDVYNGTDVPLTDTYVKSVAESMVGVVSGTLKSSDVVRIGDMEFMKISYTAPRIVSGISDLDSEITAYMGRKNGVMYTATYSVYGTVDEKVLGDFNYFLSTLSVK